MQLTLSGLQELANLIADRAGDRSPPFVVALDGRSGVGKSTLARALCEHLDAALIEGDDFYAGGTQVRQDPAASRAAACIDWTRQRMVLGAIRAGQEIAWRAFDWDSFDGRLCDVPKVIAPRPLVIIEGVYAARPELAGLVDLRIFVVVSDAERQKRLCGREPGIGAWERSWHEAEDHYFTSVMPVHRFDAVFDASDPYPF